MIIYIMSSKVSLTLSALFHLTFSLFRLSVPRYFLRSSLLPPYVVAFPLYSWIVVVVSLYCRPFLSFATCPTSVQLSPSHLPCAVSTSFACRQSFTIHFLSHLHFPRLTCCIAMSPDFLPDESVIGIFVYSAVIQ